MVDEKNDPFKRSIGVYLDTEVIEALDKIAVSQRRSRNWIINETLAEQCGLKPRYYITQREHQ